MSNAPKDDPRTETPAPALVTCWRCKREVPEETTVCVAGIGTHCKDKMSCRGPRTDQLAAIRRVFDVLHDSLTKGPSYSASRIAEELGVRVADLHGHGLQDIANALFDAQEQRRPTATTEPTCAAHDCAECARKAYAIETDRSVTDALDATWDNAIEACVEEHGHEATPCRERAPLTREELHRLAELAMNQPSPDDYLAGIRSAREFERKQTIEACIFAVNTCTPAAPSPYWSNAQRAISAKLREIGDGPLPAPGDCASVAPVESAPTGWDLSVARRWFPWLPSDDVEAEKKLREIRDRETDSSRVAIREQHAPSTTHPCSAWEGRVRAALDCHARGAPDALTAILDIMADVQEFERGVCTRLARDSITGETAAQRIEARSKGGA